MKDNVNHPEHYGGKDNVYEAIKIIEAHNLGFHLGNAVKYILRAGKKDDFKQDIKKAIWYLKRSIGDDSPETFKKLMDFAMWVSSNDIVESVESSGDTVVYHLQERDNPVSVFELYFIWVSKAWPKPLKTDGIKVLNPVTKCSSPNLLDVLKFTEFVAMSGYKPVILKGEYFQEWCNDSDDNRWTTSDLFAAWETIGKP